MFVFGSGVLIGTQLNVPNPTPINFGLVQKVSIDTSVTVKELYGQFAYPVAVGSGTRKVSCKASLARFSGQALGRLFYNQVPAPGTAIAQFAEAHNSATTTITITPPGSGVFVSDQGITYASTGLPLLCVASAPTVGQYAVTSGGIYTIATADENTNLLISYTYSSTAVGEKLIIGNPLVGPTASFSALLFATDPSTNAQFSVTLNQCVANKFSFATNIEDFSKPDFEFQAFANAAGQVMTFNFGDAA